MKLKLCVAALGFAAVSAFAAPPAGAPAGTTGMCNDGSFSNAASKQGACRGHKGVKEWYAAAPAAAPASKAAPAVAAKPAAPAKPATPAVAATPVKPATPAVAATPAAPAKPAAPAAKPAPAPVAKAAPAAPGQVWVNETSKIYHCAGSKAYGTTKNGAYMSESEAQAKGFRAARNKACAA